MKPHQIISPMTYKGQTTRSSLPDHGDRIHVGFPPLFGANKKLSAQVAAASSSPASGSS